eukprot:1369267-Amphidinium_carterae.1
MIKKYKALVSCACLVAHGYMMHVLNGNVVLVRIDGSLPQVATLVSSAVREVPALVRKTDHAHRDSRTAA